MTPREKAKLRKVCERDARAYQRSAAKYALKARTLRDKGRLSESAYNQEVAAKCSRTARYVMGVEDWYGWHVRKP